MLQVFLFGCCICFAMAFQVFLQVFQTHVSSVSSVFRCLLQIFHLNVSKVDRVLHMLHVTHLPQALAAAARASCMYVGKRRDVALHSGERTKRMGKRGEQHGAVPAWCGRAAATDV